MGAGPNVHPTSSEGPGVEYHRQAEENDLRGGGLSNIRSRFGHPNYQGSRVFLETRKGSIALKTYEVCESLLTQEQLLGSLMCWSEAIRVSSNCQVSPGEEP